MRLSRAIVSTPVGLVPQAIRDGVNGLLVPPGEVEPLSDALEKVLSNPAKAKSLGDAAFQESDQWDVQIAVDKLVLFYRRLVGKW